MAYNKMSIAMSYFTELGFIVISGILQCLYIF